MKKLIGFGMAGVILAVTTGCETAKPVAATADGVSLKTAALAIKLPAEYRNPDGMTIRDGQIWLTVNNVSQDAPSCIVKITAKNRLEKVVDLPKSEETGTVSALGLVFASDGNLYVSDNQNLGGQGFGKSRVLRVNMQEGKAVGVDVVAVGLHSANGIAARGDSLFVNETTFGDAKPLISGTYRFKLAELDGDKPVKVDGTPNDPHVIFTMETEGQYAVGANGLCFDDAGRLYVANFGDQEIWRLIFNPDGSVAKNEMFVKVFCAESIDGMQYDGQGNIWFADFIGCAVIKVSTDSGMATLIAKNAPGDGANGELDAPSECIRLGGKVYVSNIDLTFGPNKADDIHTISVIELQ